MRDGASRIGERHQLTAYRPFMSPALLRYDDRFAAEAVSSEAACDRQQPLHCRLFWRRPEREPSVDHIS